MATKKETTNIMRYNAKRKYNGETQLEAYKPQGMNSTPGEDIVDRTNFRPNAESVRAKLLSPNGLGAATIGIYDFKDGKDTGYKPFRDIGADIVDLQEQMDARVKEGESAKIKQLEQDEIRQTLKEAVKDGIGEVQNSD